MKITGAGILAVAMVATPATAQPPVNSVRPIVLQSGHFLLCWRIRFPDGQSGTASAWPSVCVPASQAVLCTETQTEIDCTQHDSAEPAGDAS